MYNLIKTRVGHIEELILESDRGEPFFSTTTCFVLPYLITTTLALGLTCNYIIIAFPPLHKQFYYLGLG